MTVEGTEQRVYGTLSSKSKNIIIFFFKQDNIYVLNMEYGTYGKGKIKKVNSTQIPMFLYIGDSEFLYIPPSTTSYTGLKDLFGVRTTGFVLDAHDVAKILLKDNINYTDYINRKRYKLALPYRSIEYPDPPIIPYHSTLSSHITHIFDMYKLTYNLVSSVLGQCLTSVIFTGASHLVENEDIITSSFCRFSSDENSTTFLRFNYSNNASLPAGIFEYDDHNYYGIYTSYVAFTFIKKYKHGELSRDIFEDAKISNSDFKDFSGSNFNNWILDPSFGSGGVIPIRNKGYIIEDALPNLLEFTSISSRNKYFHLYPEELEDKIIVKVENTYYQWNEDISLWISEIIHISNIPNSEIGDAYKVKLNGIKLDNTQYGTYECKINDVVVFTGSQWRIFPSSIISSESLNIPDSGILLFNPPSTRYIINNQYFDSEILSELLINGIIFGVVDIIIIMKNFTEYSPNNRDRVVYYETLGNHNEINYININVKLNEYKEQYGKFGRNTNIEIQLHIFQQSYIILTDIKLTKIKGDAEFGKISYQKVSYLTSFSGSICNMPIILKIDNIISYCVKGYPKTICYVSPTKLYYIYKPFLTPTKKMIFPIIEISTEFTDVLDEWGQTIGHPRTYTRFTIGNIETNIGEDINYNNININQIIQYGGSYIRPVMNVDGNQPTSFKINELVRRSYIKDFPIYYENIVISELGHFTYELIIGIFGGPNGYKYAHILFTGNYEQVTLDGTIIGGKMSKSIKLLKEYPSNITIQLSNKRTDNSLIPNHAYNFGTHIYYRYNTYISRNSTQLVHLGNDFYLLPYNFKVYSHNDLIIKNIDDELFPFYYIPIIKKGEKNKKYNLLPY